MCTIIGTPGSGKTRALLDLAYGYCKRGCELLESSPGSRVVLPLFVPLRHCGLPRDVKSRIWQEIVLGAINCAIRRHGYEFGCYSDLHDLLESHDAVFFLDGLNEMGRKALTVLLDSLRDADSLRGPGAQVRVVVSSRVREYTRMVVDFPDPAVRRLASNPYMLCRLCEAAPLVVSGEPLHMFSLLNGRIPGVEDVSPLIDSMTRARLLLRRSSTAAAAQADEDLLEFCHQIFQEFYLARYILEEQIKPCLASGRPLKGLLRVFAPYQASRWYWEAAAMAAVRLGDLDWRLARSVLARFVARSPHLASLALATLPSVKRNGRRSQQVKRNSRRARDVKRLIAKVRHRVVRHVNLWAFRVPLAYAWIPLAILGSAWYAVWLAWSLTTDWLSPGRAASEGGLLLGAAPGLLLGAVLFVVFVGCYFRLLHVVYSRLDAFIFDTKVRPDVASLQTLRWLGGRKALLALRLRAEQSAYMGDSMRNWLCSVASLRLSKASTLFERLAEPDRMHLISLLGRQADADSIAVLLQRLRDRRTKSPEQAAILGELEEILRCLSPDDPQHEEIFDTLRGVLEVAKTRAIKNFVRRLLGRPAHGFRLPHRRDVARRIRSAAPVLIWVILCVVLGILWREVTESIPLWVALAAGVAGILVFFRSLAPKRDR